MKSTISTIGEGGVWYLLSRKKVGKADVDATMQGKRMGRRIMKGDPRDNVHEVVVHTCCGEAGKGRQRSLRSRTEKEKSVVDNSRYQVDPRPLETLP